jgi:hypothetical protein
MRVAYEESDHLGRACSRAAAKSVSQESCPQWLYKTTDEDGSPIAVSESLNTKLIRAPMVFPFYSGLLDCSK